MPHEDIVRSWMMTSLSDGGIDRFDDLHIDRIDPAWKDRGQWLDGGLRAFIIATACRDQGKLPIDVALAFSLVAGEDPDVGTLKKASDLAARFDWSPPSLYLLRPGKMPWENAIPSTGRPADVLTKRIDPALLGAPKTAKGAWYIEFRPTGSAELSRTVFLVG